MIRKAVAAAVFAIILCVWLSYTSCGMPVNTSSIAPSTNGTATIGNPMTQAASGILYALCGLVNRCNQQASVSSCANALLSSGGIDYQLGLSSSTYANYASIVSANEAGTILASTSNLDVCVSAINNASCTTSVTQAYDLNVSNPFAGVALIVPTAPGSCPSVFSEPTTNKDYYVATTGSDTTGDGSLSKPWATITHAAQALTPGPSGATVHVAAGVYAPAAISCAAGTPCGIVTSRSGTAGARITFISDQQGGAKITPTGAYNAWYNTGSYVDIVGFEVTGDSSSNFGIRNDGSFVHINGNHVHGIPVTQGCANANGGAGINNSLLTSQGIEVTGNTIHDIGPILADGLTVDQYCDVVFGVNVQNPNARIMNNVIYRVATYGIQLHGSASNMKVSHNLVFNTGAKTDLGNYVGGGLYVGASGGTTDDNNSVTNNIFRDNRGGGIQELGATGANNFYSNNVFYANGYNTLLQNGITAKNSILVDPQMVNFKSDGTGDYRLTGGSPALDTGTLNCAAATGSGNCTPSTDITGFARPFGAGLDVGPYEFHP